jgi:hypothetical protein
MVRKIKNGIVKSGVESSSMIEIKSEMDVTQKVVITAA